jgi:hypothetical protein
MPPASANMQCSESSAARHWTSEKGILLISLRERVIETAFRTKRDLTGSESKASMTIYSAHDTTVFSLLAALGAAESSHLPGFTSHVILELWQEEPCAKEAAFSVALHYDGLPIPLGNLNGMRPPSSGLS